MSKTDIPKKSRNKYGYIKTVDGKNYITTQQMMMTSSNGGGSGGGTIINNQVAVAIGNQIAEKTNSAKEESYTYISSQLLSYVSFPQLEAMSYVTSSNMTTTLSQYSTTTEVSNMIDSAKLYADEKASQDSTEAKNESMSYTETKVNDMKSAIDNELANYAWPVGIATSNYIVAAMEVGTMRGILINNSSTINLTMPGDSTQQYVIIAMNVITSVLVSAGKNPRYIAAAGGSSTAISWTSTAEPYMLCFVVRLS